MKKFILLIFLSISFSSCISLHSGYLTGVAPANQNNFEYVGNAVGTSQAFYMFGLGGFSREGLVRKAKNDLILNNPVKDGQVLVNFTFDQQRTFWLGLFWTQKVIVTADIIEYQN